MCGDCPQRSEKDMVSKKVTIKDKVGLHLRPAGALCKEAGKYKSKVQLVVRNTTSNAKSVISVLAACVKCGDEIEIQCEGEDEEEALEAIVKSIEHGLENAL